MPGDASEAVVLLQLARQYQLCSKRWQKQPNSSYQRMFLFSSPPVWFTANCRGAGNWTIPGAFGNEARRIAGNRSEAVQAADDRFKARLYGQPKSFTERAECAFGQRTGVGRRYYLFAFERRRLLLFSVPSGQVHAPNRRVESFGADDGAACHRRVSFSAACRFG